MHDQCGWDEKFAGQWARVSINEEQIKKEPTEVERLTEYATSSMKGAIIKPAASSSAKRIQNAQRYA